MSSQTNPKRRCCFCGTELYGRADKKFCDDNCRNNYHYRIRLKDNDDLVIKMVNSTLLKCRETLKTLCLGQKKIVVNSHMAFDFTAPDDSSFMAGDSISFSFDALFVNEGRDSLRQRAYAGVLVRYADGTSDNLGIEILRSGRHAIELPRNMESRLESMDGFVYYSDNDSLSKAKLMLSDISLKKFSAKNSGETEEKK